MFRLARLGLRIFVEWNREFCNVITTYCKLLRYSTSKFYLTKSHERPDEEQRYNSTLSLIWRGTGRGEVGVNDMPLSPYCREKDPVSTVQEARLSPRAVWTGALHSAYHSISCLFYHHKQHASFIKYKACIRCDIT